MRTTLFALVILAFLSPEHLLAVDGEVLINQSVLNAAGGTYTITQPGSYKLSGSLTVPTPNTSAIVIASNNVTIDLNGFSITGPVNCAGGPLCGIPVPNIGTGHGIRAGADLPAQGYFNITIRNGTIQGMGADGIHILGDSITLKDLHIWSNGLSGILVRTPGGISPQGQTNLIVHHCTIQRNGSYGIKTEGGVITENTIDQSGNSGLNVQAATSSGGGIVSRNVVSRSTDFGLLLQSGVSYVGNVLMGNVSGQVVGGINLGQNICNGVVCP